MRSAPYQTAEEAGEVGARKGTRIGLAQAFIAWARERAWKRIVEVAHCDHDWFYGNRGGGEAFWQKAGLRVAGPFYKRLGVQRRGQSHRGDTDG